MLNAKEMMLSVNCAYQEESPSSQEAWVSAVEVFLPSKVPRTQAEVLLLDLDSGVKTMAQYCIYFAKLFSNPYSAYSKLFLTILHIFLDAVYFSLMIYNKLGEKKKQQ